MAKAKFRMVHTSFWNDPTVSEEMTPEDKYFFLYLLTNEHTTQIGIYGISKNKWRLKRATLLKVSAPWCNDLLTIIS